MTLRLGLAVALAVLSVASLPAQTSRGQEVQLKAAQYKEQVEGDLRGAIKEYEKVTTGPDRALAAQALLQMADIHQRLGDGQADAVYQRLIREFPEQTSSVRFARQRRAAISAQLQVPARARATEPAPSPAPVAISADRLKDVAVFDRKGTLLLRVSESEPINCVSISPDGERVAYSPGRSRIVVLDVPSRTRTEVHSAAYSPAGWSPDGARLTYLKGPLDSMGVFVSSVSGPGDETLLMPSPNGIYHWSADGRFVVAGLGGNFVAIPADGGAPIPFLAQFTASGPRLSPDSGYVAYTSSGVRESEIMVRPSLLNGFAGGALGREVKVSTGGALGMARWRSDGGELYYISPDGSVMASPTSMEGREFSAGPPVRLFRTPSTFPLSNVVGQRADVSGNGERFVFLLAAAH